MRWISICKGRLVSKVPSANCTSILALSAAFGNLLWAVLLPATAMGQSATAAQPVRETVAVLQFQAVDATPAEGSATTDRFQEELLKTGKYVLVDRAQMDEVLKEQALQQTGCTSTECAVQVGRVLGVRHLVFGKITHLDDRHWLLAAQLIDVETSVTARASSVQYEGAFFDLLQDGIPVLAARIAGVTPATKPGLGSRLLERINPFASSDASSGTEVIKPEPPPNAPKRGFSLISGLAYTSASLKLKSGGGADFSAVQYPNVGIEYQFVLNAPLSLSLFYVGSSGSLSGSLTNYYSSLYTSQGGVELRYWQGRSYIGGLIAGYSAALIDNNPNGRDNSALTLNGNALGGTAGYEWDNGWYLQTSFVYAVGTASQNLVRSSAQSSQVSVGGDFSAETLWVDIGYRWK